MNVLIDFSQIPLKKVGVGVYAIRTFSLLFALDSQNQYILILQNDDFDFDVFSSFQNVKIIRLNAKLYRNILFRLFFEQLGIPYFILKYKIDTVHSLHYSFPLLRFKAKRVITIHDLSFFLYPEVHTSVKRLYFKIFIFLAAKTKNRLICVSKSTASDLKRLFPVTNSYISVVPLAMESLISIQPLRSVELIKKKYNILNEYVLFIGTLEPRKNLVCLIEAFEKISNCIDLDLVIIGKKGWFYEEIFLKVIELNLQKRIVFTGFVSECEKYSILSECSIFIYPSIYEGFGLPVLEAFAFGKATITSNVSSMPEIAGDAALLIDPSSIDEIANAMLELITNKELRESLSKKALYQASLFTWEKTAQNTLDIYNQ